MTAALKAFRMAWSGTGGQGGALNWSRVLLPGAQHDYVREVGDVTRNSAVSICLGWIADNVSEPELHVVRRRPDGTQEVAQDHPLPVLVGSPNPWYDGDALWAATIVSFCVSGNAYWLKGRTDAGRVRELWYVPHWRMRPEWPADGTEFIRRYVYRVNGREYEIPREDVIHFRFGLDPDTDGRLGISRLTPVLREIYSDNQAATYTAAILRNMGVPGVLLNPRDGTTIIDAESRRGLLELWSDGATGDNRGKPILPSVALSVERLGLSPEELALDKIRQVPEARICAALRIPPMVVGLNVGNAQRTYSNYSEAREAAYEDCLLPMQRRFARTLDRHLLGEFGDAGLVKTDWDYSQVRALREDEDALYRRQALAYRSGIIRRSEARASLGLESDAGDEQYYAGAAPKAGPPASESGDAGGA